MEATMLEEFVRGDMTEEAAKSFMKPGMTEDIVEDLVKRMWNTVIRRIGVPNSGDK
jgi:hypothetical protein